jgi:hypothetical protein
MRSSLTTSRYETTLRSVELPPDGKCHETPPNAYEFTICLPERRGELS